MKKSFALLALLTVLVTAYTAKVSASWWNPLSWFKKPSAAVTVPVTSTSVPTAPVVSEKPALGVAPSVIELTGKETSVTLKIGDTIKSRGMRAMVTEVLEDSRCPQDVQCIQAGTVHVSVKGSYGLLSKTATFTLGQSVEMRGYSVVLSAVTPEKTAGDTIATSAYAFTFTVKKI
jgi:hypothetical protein